MPSPTPTRCSPWRSGSGGVAGVGPVPQDGDDDAVEGSDDGQAAAHRDTGRRPSLLGLPGYSTSGPVTARAPRLGQDPFVACGPWRGNSP